MFYNLIILSICFNYVFSDSIKTTSGVVKGQTIQLLNQSINQYLGIPYAEPPIGSLRFAKPKPKEFQNGIIDATKPKYSCIQVKSDLDTWLKTSEDCLSLNIWSAKNTTSLKPVMFWIYGGGLSIGSIYDPEYNGSVLATHDIVFVSVNYRLGSLGFLYLESVPANLGFFDQLLALKWVRENIHLFGGDKNQITIFGESAGSWSVSAHLVSPLSKGLFKRAIMESGSLLFNKDRPIVSKEEASLEAKQLIQNANCSDVNQWLECLRNVSEKYFIPKDYRLTFPVVGTEILPFSEGKTFTELKFNKDLDLMAGVTRDEGSFLFDVSSDDIIYNKRVTKEDFLKFVNKSDEMFHNLNIEKLTDFYLSDVNISDSNAIKWKIYDFFGDLFMKCPTYLFAKRYAEHSSNETNVFFYELTHLFKQLIPGIDLGVTHTSDLPLVFGLDLVKPENISQENIDFIKQVMKYWTDFAKYGFEFRFKY